MVAEVTFPYFLLLDQIKFEVNSDVVTLGVVISIP